MNLKIFTDNIEEKALTQIHELLAQPVFSEAKVRIMPDVHAGAGCVIGFTADLGDKVIPNVVGVDIGCGMHVVKLGNINIDLQQLDNFIKENIPSGFAVNSQMQVRCFDEIKELYCYNELKNVNRLLLGIGSLGGGNHFIEVDEDEEGCKYLVIHTGSRNLGKQVADIYQNKAITYCYNNIKSIINTKIEELKSQNRLAEINDAIQQIKKEFNDKAIPKELCYLEGELREQYLHDMRICQKYAVLNRHVIAGKITAYLESYHPKMSYEYYPQDNEYEWECIHNYIDDNNMVRKGAIAAHKGQKVIIPLNMRDGSILGIGRGNSEWNESGPHGAGRIMSRAQAKQQLSVDDFEASMEGIYTTTANISTIDEAPMAYKPAQEIINAIGDTIEITKIIKPIYNFKAGDE